MTQAAALATDTSHFDRWGPQYDLDEVHPRIVSLLLEPVHIRAGSRVLDIATGTGLVALNAAREVGRTGEVVGIDIAEGMLAVAHRKAQAAGLENVVFRQADAEKLSFRPESFDYIFCSSALVLMQDMASALRHWRGFLKPGGAIAFDTPAKPFGISDYAITAAAMHGVRLAYGDAADTFDKCRYLLAGANLEPISIRTATVSSGLLPLETAVAMYDDRIDHPAWRAIREASPLARAAIRTDFIASITAGAIAGHIADDTALNFASCRRPALSPAHAPLR